MATVFDIAAHIQNRLGSLDRMRMNKLAYYVQAWSLVWRGEPAFGDRIEAWKNGPVVRNLWVAENYNHAITPNPLPAELVAHVDRVLLAYGHMPAEKLSHMTHSEGPWKSARGTTPPGTNSSEEITTSSLKSYYTRLWNEAERDNAAASGPPAFVGSVDEFEAFINS